jgi:dihydroorotate dehydrogenase
MRGPMLFERAVRPVLFRIGRGDAEAAHEWTLHRLTALSRHQRALALLRRHYLAPAPREVFGLRFPNRVGLAAGMDKDAVALAAWPALGFGFVEVGTVTWHAQPGNARPRLFRLPRSAALINRMGFNNRGARALADRLDAHARTGPRLDLPVGISIGKSKIAALGDAAGDYLASLRALYAYGDYFAINVSSPNTPGLQALQDRGHLDDLLAALQAEAGALAGTGTPAKPLLVKVAPDLTDSAIADLLAVCLDHGVAGVIATNTTVARSGLAPRDVSRGNETGGLSGRPLARRTLEVVRFVHRETGGRLPIVGVGGILDADDAVRLVDAGASLVQIYTGLIYRGPRLVRAAAEALRAADERSDALGREAVARATGPPRWPSRRGHGSR